MGNYDTAGPMKRGGGHEEHYELMNFPDAMHAAKAGHAVARRGWNGKDQAVVHIDYRKIGTVDALPRLENGYVMSPLNAIVRGGLLDVWMPTNEDMTAGDWRVVVIGSTGQAVVLGDEGEGS